jgi:hypothetical protein
MPPEGLSRRSDMAKLTTSAKTYPTKPYSQYLTSASITQRFLTTWQNHATVNILKRICTRSSIASARSASRASNTAATVSPTETAVRPRPFQDLARQRFRSEIFRGKVYDTSVITTLQTLIRMHERTNATNAPSFQRLSISTTILCSGMRHVTERILH